MYYSASILNFFYNSASMLKAGLKPTIWGGGGGKIEISQSHPPHTQTCPEEGNFSILYCMLLVSKYETSFG